VEGSVQALKKYVKYSLGRTVAVLAPFLVREIEAGTNTSRHAWLKKQVLDSKIAYAKKTNSFNDLQDAHFRYWQGEQGTNFYGAYPERFNDWFLGDHFIFVEELQKLMKSDDGFKYLYEIGCGDGQVLNYLSKNLAGIERAVGLDINETIIEENNRTFADNTALTFISGDASKWIAQNIQAGTILLSYGGVFEYFSEEALRDIFKALKSGTVPVLVVLVEPISKDHDLNTVSDSQPFGREDSFSHNHEHLLKSAGFNIEFECEKYISDRWKIIIASAR
jgi:SAM-dependent methyltransferase